MHYTATDGEVNKKMEKSIKKYKNMTKAQKNTINNGQERLLLGREVAERLCMRPRTFRDHRDRLVAKGLQPVGREGNKFTYYRESSLNKIIQEAAETGRPL